MQASAVVGAGLAIGGPISAYAANSKQGGKRRKALGFGPLAPTPEKDTANPGETYRVE